jgi:hypothetical protein
MPLTKSQSIMKKIRSFNNIILDIIILHTFLKCVFKCINNYNLTSFFLSVIPYYVNFLRLLS